MNQRTDRDSHNRSDYLMNSNVGGNRSSFQNQNDPNNPGSPPIVSNRTRRDSSGASQATASNVSFNTRDTEDSFSRTYQLVNALKRKIESNPDKNHKIDESFIESEVVKIRKDMNKELDVSIWKENLPANLKQCPERVIYASMAYGDNPDEVKTVLQAKTNAIKTPTTTSLDASFEPLKILLKNIRNSETPNLFDAVLKFKDDEIDRADRMFYSEARQYLKGPKFYTYQHAHDQVLAIRLMNFYSNDTEILKDLINEYQTFDDAYSYLQNLTKIQSSKKSTTTSESFIAQRSRTENRSIVGRTTAENGYPANNYSPSSGTDRYGSGYDRTTSIRANHAGPSYRQNSNGDSKSTYPGGYNFGESRLP